VTLVDGAVIVRTARVAARVGTPPERAVRVVRRSLRLARAYRLAVATSFLEPVLMLISLGMGVGGLVGTVPGPGGEPLAYDQFVAPAMLAVAAMNGALMDTTFGFFVNLKYAKAYDAMLATPLGAGDVARGELVYTLAKGTLYAAGFLAVMAAFGLTPSWWSLLTIPVAVLVGLVPSFLFSATFFPIERYPDAVGTVVRWTPLYQGVVLARDVTLGHLHAGLLLNVLYLVVVGCLGLAVASRRIEALLQP
jgi:lipooligosaccharide transport system permease protein